MSTSLRSTQCSRARQTPSSISLPIAFGVQRRLIGSKHTLPITRRLRHGNLLITAAVKEPVKSDLPDGMPKAKSKWRRYETILCLNPTLTNEQKDAELAKIQAFLLKAESQDVEAVVKGLHRLAYPIKKHTEGTYVLITFTAKRAVAKMVEQRLSSPEAGTEDFILRWRTFIK